MCHLLQLRYRGSLHFKKWSYMMHRRVFSLFVVLFFSFCFLYAQDDSEWFWDKTIATIEFEGLKNVKKSDLGGIISDYEGMPFNEQTYNDILDSLYSMDLFEDIVPYAKHDTRKYDEVLLVFQVKERSTIKAINFTGNKKIRNGELRDKIKIKTTDVYVESKVLLDERTLRNYFLEKGYTNSTVSHTSEVKDDGVVITFIISEGANTVIKEINFEGATIASARTLRSKLELKEVGFMKDGAFQTSLLEQDKRSLISFYREKGYVDAELLDVKIESNLNEDKQRNELTITYIISEGAKYTFTGLAITGNEVFSTDELMSLAKLKVGSVYNETKLQEAFSNIAGKYYENGYMSNEFYPVPQKDTNLHEISYSLVITEGPRSHIENIIIKGNTKTKDYVIRREIPIESGDIFSRNKIMSAYRNLMNLQYFSSVMPEYQSGSEPNLVDLVWNVEEQSTTNLNFGMTFSGSADPTNPVPISLYVKIENSNLKGEGKAISGSVTVSSSEQSLALSYSQNWIGNLPITYSQSLSFSHSTETTPLNYFSPNLDLQQYYYYMNYKSWAASLGTSFGRRWSYDWAVLTGAAGLSNSVNNNIYDETVYVPVDQGVSTFANRWGWLNSVWTSFSIDGRDINYDPSKGYFVSERLSWYGLIPTIEQEFFLKTDTKGELYFTLFSIPFTENYTFKSVLALSSNFISVFPTQNTTVSDSNRLYVDGMFNGRGWTEAYKDGKGLVLWSNKAELRFPIVPNILGADVFLDYAVVKDNFAALSSLKISDFYCSFGPGIRILLQQFPLHLMFAFRYQHDSNGVPHFNKDSPFQFVLSFNLVNR